MNILEEDNNSTDKNKEDNNPPYIIESENGINIPAPNGESNKSRNPVKQLEFEVDTSKKPEVIKEPTKILQGEEVSAFISLPTEGDLKKKQQQEQANNNNNNNSSSSANTNDDVSKLRNTSASSTATEQVPPVTIDPTKRRKKAEKYAKLLDLVIVQGLKFWSGQADDTGMKTPEGDLTVMADAIEDIMVENNYTGTNSWVEGATSLGAVYAGHFKQAQKSRKLLQEFKKTEAYKKAKEAEAQRQMELKEKKLDFFKGTYKKNKGGQRKA